MTTIHSLGFPRIGARRELKQGLEAYWRGEQDLDALLALGSELRRRHWQLQSDAGLDWVPAGDFSWYDGVLDMSVLLGVVPARFGSAGGPVDLDTYFRMARGRAPRGEDVPACEMTKWFDTNYHYIVPEFEPGQRFGLGVDRLFREVEEAQAAGFRTKPVLIGPLTYLWLGKMKAESQDRLGLLDGVLPVYGDILRHLAELGVEWVQIDEPILAMDLDARWQAAFEHAYDLLQTHTPRLLMATYFGDLGDNLRLAARLPVDGLHLDLVRAPGQLDRVLDLLPPWKLLSAGIVDGRNVWRTDLDHALSLLETVRQRLGDRLWLAPSCSLLHVPVDVSPEDRLDPELKGWLAFALQKLEELAILRRALVEGREAVAPQLEASRKALEGRRSSSRVRAPGVRARLDAVDDSMTRRRSPYRDRAERQRRQLGLPPFPATTIGSFPQTADIRAVRRDFREGRLDETQYERRMQQEIARAVREQEALGLDVLVHGEPERNDMVEHFGELLDGVAITRNGWVQSYGSRCVKPPIIYGDVSRPGPMTVKWIRYAQSLTDKPVKGMLTGPVTILQWSFVRDDQPRRDTCRQIALALRDEVADLEAAGVRVIQIDEPALREGLPLRRTEWQVYLDWAVACFRLASSAVMDETQIHTHMCYSEFNDIIEAIAALDADVITIETARSDMELLEAFADFEYPNEIGPGVYDIHSPRVPSAEEMAHRLAAAARVIPPQRLWVNPDCGLKTRSWDEIRPALENMVAAAHRLREAEVTRGVQPQ